jgi:DNA-binding response OmpR family regulator
MTTDLRSPVLVARSASDLSSFEVEVKEKSAKVLIVDDDPSILRTLSENCARIGLEVHTAKNGLQAILRAKRNPPRLIILERQLLEADAFRVCEWLLDPKRPPVDVIVLTEGSDIETLDRCDSLGAYCVPKGPDTWNMLLSIFVEVLGIDNGFLALLAPVRKQRTDPLAVDRLRNKILIVDDDMDLTKALARRLQKCGAVTFTAENGISGFRIAMRERPDVIISDHLMPNGGGDYMNWRLKSMEATKHIPIIVITGAKPDAGENDPKGPDQEGPVIYFHKPLDIDALLTETSRHCAIHYDRFDAPQ